LIHAQSIAVDLEYYEDSSYYDTLHLAQQEAPYRPTQIINSLIQVAQNGISLLGIAGLLLSFNWVLGLVLFCAGVPGVVVRLWYARKLFRIEQKQSETERQAWYYHWMMVDTSFAKELRLFNLGALFIERFRRLRQMMRTTRLGLTKNRSLADFLVQLLASIAIYGTLGLAAFQAMRGAITLGELVTIYIGFQSGVSFLQAVLNGLAGLYEDNLFLSNLYLFLDMKPAIRAPAQPQPMPAKILKGIRFDDVSFRYKGSSEPALQDIQLTLAPGEVIALVGENGSGKTTLIKLLSQLYLPESGQITLDGIDLRRFDPVHWRRDLSVIFQDYVHYYMKAWENIWIGNVERKPDLDPIQKIARMTGAEPVIRRLPLGYDTNLGSWFEEGHELSTGEWQKVALARAFWRDARIVILDEPTSSLDPLAEAELFRNFRKLIDGRSAILISHRFSTVQLADRIYVLDHGRIVESGNHTELMQLKGRYANLYQAQAEHYQKEATVRAI
jgi:ATP-binding cassette subfamily B protein